MADGLDLDKLALDVAKQVGLELDSKINSKLKAALKSELRSSLSKGADDLALSLLAEFDKLTSEIDSRYGKKIKDKDPTNLSRFRSEFESSIKRDLTSISISDSEVVIQVGNKKEFGFGEDRNSPLYPLAYYIEGVIGEFAFLDRESYLSAKPSSEDKIKFGEGFMISREDFVKEEWSKKLSSTFEDYLHPVSGFPPFRGFNTAAEEFDWSPYVNEAVQKAFTKILS